MYTAASAVGLTVVYNLNKETFFSGDKSIHYAFSLWPFGNSEQEIDLSDTLAGTVTDEKKILDNKNLMRYKMEAFITNLQGKIIKKLQEQEPESKFIVDKWTRKEVLIFFFFMKISKLKIIKFGINYLLGRWWNNLYNSSKL